MKKIIISTILVLVALTFTAFIFDWGRGDVKAPGINLSTSTSENVEQNSTSTPNMPIVVFNIKDNQEISNPIIIEGKARGNWFFEASFPIELIDMNGERLGIAIAQAEGEWMTTDFVNFKATLEYKKSLNTNKALLILSKDNPSGLPENDQSIFIPVIIK